MRNPRSYLRSHPECLRLYAVTDSAWLDGRSLESCVDGAVEGGATFVQLRDKHAGVEGLVDAARRLGAVCGERAVFVVNDSVEAALAADADGVHVGQDDAACRDARALLGPDKIVGVSVQTVEQALDAVSQGADYLGVGALFKTATKPEAADVSMEELAAICAAVDVPVVGIGGLNEATVACLAGTGVEGAAVVSAIFAAPDTCAAARELRRIIDAAL